MRRAERSEAALRIGISFFTVNQRIAIQGARGQGKCSAIQYYFQMSDPAGQPTATDAMTSSQHLYKVRPRKDYRGVDLISDALPFGRLWYGEPDAAQPVCRKRERQILCAKFLVALRILSAHNA
jgi:hypothetical protein